MSSMHKLVGLAALIGLGGCSYDSADGALPEVVNSCSPANECAAGAECENGMCIAQKVDAPLTIALEVTPVRMRDGTDPLPITIAPFMVDGPMRQRTLELTEPVLVSGYVRSMNATSGTAIEVPLEADVSFTPLDTIRGLPSKTITVAAGPAVRPSADTDYMVRLLRGGEYRMVVRPRDPTLPPRYETIVANGEPLHAVYPAPADLPSVTVVVTGDYAGRILRVRALSADGAEPLSSTGTVDRNAETKRYEAKLTFVEQPRYFTLEIRAEPSFPETKPQVPPILANAAVCDNDTPSYPVFTARSVDLADSDDPATLHVDLPELPKHISFVGTVELCSDGQDADAPLESLTLSLHASNLLPADSVLSASFDASTTARPDSELQSGELSFCVQVIPGPHYEVLATPASSLPCALLTDMRPIAAPPGELLAPVSLELPMAAYLSGTLVTMDEAPLRGAAIDAIALAPGGTGTRYNRSRPTATDTNGSFKLQVDFGRYDVVIKPAPGSGLPWQVRHDVMIGDAQDFATSIDMHLPVTVQGSLRYRGASSADPSLKDAVVAAYAIVDDGDSERAVPIGSATADESGRFTLLLPPSIQSGWLSPTRR